MTAADPVILAAYRFACRLDVAVMKPGNVSAGRPGHGMTAADFLASARASAGPLVDPGLGVGARIEAAITATRAVVACNTNLGIVLLAAPLAKAMQQFADRSRAAGHDAEPPPRPSPASLRAAVTSVLAALTPADTEAAFRAIRLANPGGLGQAASHDVQDSAAPPSLDLAAAMALAAHRDRIAAQYAEGYADLFDRILPPLMPLADGETPTRTKIDATVLRAYLACLARLPDSHIVRKHGEARAVAISRDASRWLTRLEDADPLVAGGLLAWDEDLKASGLNPGTTADLIVAALMVVAWLRPALPERIDH